MKTQGISSKEWATQIELLNKMNRHQLIMLVLEAKKRLGE